MYEAASQAYLESRVLSADPIELVRMLYQAAILDVRDARRHLEAGDIAARSRSISKACEILIELSASLDSARGGEIAARLSRLYAYIQTRLVQANCDQADAPLAESLGLLCTLSEGWEGIAPPKPRAESTPVWPVASTPECAASTHSSSF